MRRRLLYVICLLFLFCASVVYAQEVDPRVYEALETTNSVDVIVNFATDLDADTEALLAAGISDNAALRDVLRDMKKTVRRQRRDVIRHVLAEDEGFVLQNRYSYTSAFTGIITRQGLDALLAHDRVISISLNEELHLSLDTGVPHVEGDAAHNISYNNSVINGSGIGICVIDTGVDSSHGALAGTIIDEYCYCDGCCPDGSDEQANASDDNGHGTAAIGTIVSNDATYKGVAVGADIFAVKSFNHSGDATTADVILGINKCLAHADDYNIKIFSMSFGGGEYSDACDADYLGDVGNDLVEMGFFVAAASGNDAFSSAMSTPACGSNVTSVGAVYDSGEGTGDAIASFSNANPTLDLLAPGVNICMPKATGVGGLDCATTATGDFLSKSGTSFSTPMVAGAAALLMHYTTLDTGSAMLPLTVRDTLTSTGVSVEDSRNGLSFARLNVFGALASLDVTAPEITFIDPTPANNSVPSNSTATVNVSVTDDLAGIGSCLFEASGQNVSMTLTGSGTNVTCSHEIDANSTTTFRVYALDTQNNTAVTDEHVILGVLPSASDVTIIPDPLYRGEMFNCTYTYTHPSGAAENGTNITWYNNNVSVDAFADVTTVDTSLTVGDTWSCGVTPSDGTFVGSSISSSVVIVENILPAMNVSNVTVNETQQVVVSYVVSDADGDNVSVAINDSRFSTENDTFVMNTNLSSAEVFIVALSADDGYNTVVHDVTVTILDTQDTDGDGIPDVEDDDDDNDGVLDEDDSVLGSIDDVTSTHNLSLAINGSNATNTTYEDVVAVSFSSNGSTLLSFDYNFSLDDLDISQMNVTLVNETVGGIVVLGLDIPLGKTVYVDDVSDNTGVCVYDAADASLISMSSACNMTNEYFVSCDGEQDGNYTCTDLGDTLEISGLAHSAVQEICVDADGDGYGDGCSSGLDCNDDNFNVNPGKEDVPGNLIDEDCDGRDAEEEETTVTGGGTGGGGGLGPVSGGDDEGDDSLNSDDDSSDSSDTLSISTGAVTAGDDSYEQTQTDDSATDSLEPESNAAANAITGASVAGDIGSGSKKVLGFIVLILLLGGVAFGTYIKTQVRAERNIWEEEEHGVTSLIRGIKDFFKRY